VAQRPPAAALEAEGAGTVCQLTNQGESMRLAKEFERRTAPAAWVFVVLSHAAGTTGAAEESAPPSTRVEPVVDEYHGHEVVDPYRWLEGDAEGLVTDEVRAWTAAQNACTRRVLDALPGRERVAERIRELMTIDSVSLPAMRGERYFYLKQEGSQNQPVLFVRRGHDGEPRVLLDVNALDEEGLVSLDFFTPSPDGERLAFGLSRSGDEMTRLHLLEVESGRWLADEIPDKVRSVQWLPDNSGFFYANLEDPDDAYSRRIRLHRVGRHFRHDEVLFAQHSTTWGPFAEVSRDARWLVLGYYQSTRTNDLWVVDLDRWFRTGEFERVPILVGADARGDGLIHGDTFFLRTTLDAPNGRVFAVDLNRPARDHWRELLPERSEAVLEEIALARGLLVATYLRDAYTRIELLELDGMPFRALDLPGIGSASVSTHIDRTEAFLSYSSFDTPPTIYRVDLREGTRELWSEITVPVDPEAVEVRQVHYPSRDGTQISLFLVGPRDAERNGDNPTMLYGYGGFNLKMAPRFSATLFQWFEAGGLYAVPNLRGGGEYGDDWHRAGQLGRKQNVFDDFIAAAEWLIANDYTRSERLAVRGGSNGGLLTGAFVVQRPDLARAAISGVPLLDMLRYQQFLMARFWVPEYGTAENPEHFDFLRAYSPYHNVRPGTAYPAVLLTAGENDSRVHPLHARKMAARLQAATTADPAERPVLLWVETEAGHGRGKPLSLRIRDIVDERVFLMWQLGMLGDAGGEPRSR
jgi:prolyl oligopeptidase